VGNRETLVGNRETLTETVENISNIQNKIFECYIIINLLKQNCYDCKRFYPRSRQ
jgi:hypothetical protein